MVGHDSSQTIRYLGLRQRSAPVLLGSPQAEMWWDGWIGLGLIDVELSILDVILHLICSLIL